MANENRNKPGRVGIRITNSSNGTFRNVHAEGPDGGIDMENVKDMRFHNVTGRATGEVPSDREPRWWEKTWIQVVMVTAALVTLGIFVASFF